MISNGSLFRSENCVGETCSLSVNTDYGRESFWANIDFSMVED